MKHRVASSPLAPVLRQLERAADGALPLRLEAEEYSAAAVIIGERLVLPLQVGMLLLVRQIDRRQDQTEVVAEIVADLRVQLAVWRLVDRVRLRDYR